MAKDLTLDYKQLNSSIIDNVLNPSGIPLTQEEADIVNRKLNQSFLENLIEGTGYSLDRLTTTSANAYEDTVNKISELLGSSGRLSTQKGAFEQSAINDLARYNMEKELEQRAIVGGRPTVGGALAELATYALPTARLGILGKGASAIPKTAASWGAADAAISASLGNDMNRIIEDSALAAMTGGLFGGSIHGLSSLGKFRTPEQQFAKQVEQQQAPEIMIDGHYFPDDNIKQVKPFDPKEPTVRPTTKMGSKDELASDDVIAENISKPNKKEHEILQRGEGAEFEQLMQRKIAQEIGLKKLETDEGGMLTEQGKADFIQFKQTLDSIVNDPKAKEVYRNQFLEQTKAKRTPKTKEQPEPTEAQIVAGQKKAVEQELKRKELEAKAKEGISEPKKITPPKIKKTQSELKLKAEKDKTFKRLIQESKKREPRDDDSFSIYRHDAGEYVPKGQEQVIKAYDSSAIDLHTERTMVGSRNVGQRMSKADYEAEKLSKIDKEKQIKADDKALENNHRIATDNGYAYAKQHPNESVAHYMNRVKQEQKLIEKELGAKNSEDIANSFERGMQRAMLERIDAKRTASTRKVESKSTKTTPESVAKLQKKAKELEAKRDAQRKAREDKLKAEEAKTEKMSKKFDEEAKASKPKEEPKKNVPSKRTIFKAKDAMKEGYVPEHLTELHGRLSKVVGDVDVKIVDDLVHPISGKSSFGFYHAKENVIYINRKSLSSESLSHSIMHEMIHAATYTKIHSTPNLFKELNDMLEQAKFFNQDKKGYWATNADEFLAEGLTNPNVIKGMKNTSYHGTTMWEAFKSIIYKALGIKRNNISMHAKLDLVLEDIINPQPKIDKQISNMIDGSLADLKKVIGFSDKGFEATSKNWQASFRNDGVFGVFQRIHQATRRSLDDAAVAGQNTKNYMQKIFKKYGHEVGGKFDKGLYRNILSTDYRSIKEFANASEASRYLEANKSIYMQAKRMIDQTAKGLVDKGNMNSIHYRNNAYSIVRDSGLPLTPLNIEIVDKLVSIRAMDNEAWRFVKEFRGKPEFDEMMNIVDKTHVQTNAIFESSVWMKVKGYQAEHYDSIMKYEYENGVFVSRVDLDARLVQGGLPQRLDNSRMGTVEQFPKGMTSKTERIAYADKEGFGLVLDMYGNPKAMRKVASERHRTEIGKSSNATDVLPLTYENNVRKIAQNDYVMDAIRRELSNPDNGMMIKSVNDKNVPDNFVKLTEEERSRLPRELQNEITHINADFKHMMLGNKEIQIFNEGILGVAEQVLKDSVQHFKENVVLKNPASWLNNFGFAFMMNKQSGIAFSDTMRYMKEGNKSYSEMRNLMERLYVAELKNDIRGAEALREKLNGNLFYQMNQEGLASSVMSDIMHTPTGSKRFSDKALKRMMVNLFGEQTGNKIADTAAMAYFSPQAKTGQAVMNLFSRIDMMGRYSMAKANIDNGMHIAEAVKKSNSIYGDMDMIAPMWSQAIQTYGAIPFSNWFFRVSGGMTKNTKENVMKALIIFGGLEVLSEVTGKRTESMNPLASLVNTPFDMAGMSPVTRPVKYAENFYKPAILKKGARVLDDGDVSQLVMTNNF